MMTSMRRVCIIGLLVAIFAITALNVSAQEGNGWCLHKQMYAVPAPGKVVIDGKLDDWDLSGAIDVYVMPETRETQNAKFAVMYDSEALYVGAIVRDPTPLMNHNAPETEGDKGWDGDALQFRMCVDPAQKYPPSDATWLTEHDPTLTSLTMWCYTERQEPNLVVQKGMNYQSMPGSNKFGVTPEDKYQAKYLLATDKKGYSFEYRIPWSTLGAKQPLKGGDMVAAAMQLLWGRSGNEHIGVNGVVYDLQLAGGFAYQNSAIWGKVIFSPTGNLPKEMVSEGARPEKPLPLTFDYELPESSQVTLQLSNDNNEVVRVLAGEAARSAGKNIERWDGLDASGKPLPAGRYTWKGLYHQPIITRHVLSVANSGQPPWKTDSNNGGWGGDHGVPCAGCVAGDDVMLSWNCAEAGWGIIRVNTEGKKQWGILRTAIHMTTDGERVYLSNDSDEVDNPLAPAEVGCIEMVDKKDFHPLLFGNGSKVLQAPPGGDAQSNAVSGLACAGGRVYVSFRKRNLITSYDAREGGLMETFTVASPGAMAARQDGSLVVLSDNQLVSLLNGKASPLVADHLDEPKGVAVDAAGNLYISNYGKLQNVSMFSPAGKYLRSIGKTGGRPRMGDYDPTGMLYPYSVTVDAKGQLWVTEAIDSPKRVSVWNCRNGRLVKEFFGDAAYSAFIWMTPEHPDEIYCDGVIWKVNLNKKTWTPKSTPLRPADRNAPGLGDCKMFTAKNGRQYAWGGDGHGGSVLCIRQGDTMKPLLAFFWTYSKVSYIGYPITKDMTKYPEFGTYIWVDRNNDQIIQENEIMSAANLSPVCAKQYFRSFAYVDKDLNIWHDGGAVNRTLRILPDGTPEYDFSKPELTPVTSIQGMDTDGSLYTLPSFNRGGSVPSDYTYGRWSPDGKMQWGFTGCVNWPDALSYPSQQPGKFWGPTTYLGVAGEFTGFNTYFGVAHLYTTDGLFVSRIFKDVRTITELSSDIISCENYNGCLVKPKGMTQYYFLGGDQDGRVTEVLGLDTVKRLKGGEYVISDEDSNKVASALADYQAKLSPVQQLRIAHGKAALEVVQPVSKALDATRVFEAKVAYDETNLYVKYKVTCPIKLVNGSPDPTLIFKGGNAMDIQLATDPQADPQRKTPAPGDLRILVSRQAGKPMAVIYRPKVKGFQGTPIVFRTGNTESFDVIETSDRIGLAYQEDNNQQTFTAIVTIPLEVIGWKPQAGTKVKMDLGYIYGNDGGTKNAARSYWKNNSFNANVLNDVPCESRLEPAEWGEAEVE